MILCDVSVLLQACTSASPHHALCRGAVETLAGGEEAFAVSELILAAVVRLATNPRVFNPPAAPESAFAFTDALLQHPLSVSIAPGSRHWGIFRDLILSLGIRGGDTTDAYLAALAMEHGCQWWTTDAGFARFAGLDWRNLL